MVKTIRPIAPSVSRKMNEFVAPGEAGFTFGHVNRILTGWNGESLGPLKFVLLIWLLTLKEYKESLEYQEKNTACSETFIDLSVM